jgi:hypothetical protein
MGRTARTSASLIDDGKREARLPPLIRHGREESIDGTITKSAHATPDALPAAGSVSGGVPGCRAAHWTDTGGLCTALRGRQQPRLGVGEHPCWGQRNPLRHERAGLVLKSDRRQIFGGTISWHEHDPRAAGDVRGQIGPVLSVNGYRLGAFGKTAADHGPTSSVNLCGPETVESCTTNSIGRLRGPMRDPEPSVGVASNCRAVLGPDRRDDDRSGAQHDSNGCMLSVCHWRHRRLPDGAIGTTASLVAPHSRPLRDGAFAPPAGDHGWCVGGVVSHADSLAPVASLALTHLHPLPCAWSCARA